MTNQGSPASTSIERATTPAERAPLVQRFLAYAIDWILLGFVGGCLGFAGGLISPRAGSEQAQGWWTLVRGILGVAIPAGYFIWPYSSGGQTLGKRALKIKVISIDGSPLNWRKGVLRTVGYVLSALPLGLGFLWSIWDADRQAGHDKIAGTCVVPASVAREQLQGTIQPSEVGRRQRRWLLGLGIPTLLVPVGFFFLIHRGVAEVREMRPWPSPDVALEEVVTVDLSSLGLELGRTVDARDQETWSGGSYQDGVLITYVIGGKDAVGIWALRYADEQSAGNDYRSARAWAEGGNCGAYATAYWGTSGVIHCQFSDAYDKTLWNDYWIVDIVALEGTEFPPAVLVDLVRDAIATHWKAMAQPSQ